MAALSTRLREQRANTWSSMRSLLDSADAESRSLDGVESRQCDQLNAEIETLDERIKNIEDAERRSKDADSAFAQVESRQREVNPVEDTTAMQEVRGWLLMKNPATSLELRGSTQGISKAVTEVRTLSKLSNGAGGYAVPSGFYPQLVRTSRQLGHPAGRSPVINTSDGTPLPVAVTTSHATGALVAETGTIPTSEPVLGQYQLGPISTGILHTPALSWCKKPGSTLRASWPRTLAVR